MSKTRNESDDKDKDYSGAMKDSDSSTSRRPSISSERQLRRQPSSQSMRSSVNSNVFSDEYEIAHAADGFRPSFEAERSLTPPVGNTAIYRPSSFTEQDLPKQRASGFVGRNSLRRERGTPQRIPSVSAASETMTRPFSTISSASAPGSDSPYNGPVGPSHPYAMCPQINSLNRTPSTSTVRSQSAQFHGYSGPRRPTHPYGMYSQLTAVPTVIDPTVRDALAPSEDVASVGFPGRGQGYARRLSPDGEGVDDIIGLDGHAEQLPAYTRYPTVPPSKAAAEAARADESFAPLLAGAAAPSISAPPSLPPAAEIRDHPLVPPNIGLLASGHPDDAEDEDEGGPAINTAAAAAAGLTDVEHSRRKKWTKAGKKRTCWGIVPVWAWILQVILLCALAVCLGVFIGKHVGQSPSDWAMPTATVAADKNGTPTATG